MEKRAEPTMMQTMKQEKTMPRGVAPVSRTCNDQPMRGDR